MQIALLLVLCAAQSQSRDVFMPDNFFAGGQVPRLMRKASQATFPTLEQLRLVPTLSGEQQKSLRPLYDNYRSEIKQLEQELKDARVKEKETKALPEVSAVARCTLAVETRRAKMKEDIEAIVTPEQFNLLDEMKKGVDIVDKTRTP